MLRKDKFSYLLDVVWWSTFGAYLANGNKFLDALGLGAICGICIVWGYMVEALIKNTFPGRNNKA